MFFVYFVVNLFCSRISGAERPNFVIILADDLGYSDLGCFGSSEIAAPEIDRMAAEGMRLTNFHVAAPTCTASRAALMTGCYAVRVGMGDVIAPWKLRAKNRLANENIYHQPWRELDVVIPAALYNLQRDPGEQKSVMRDHPRITRRLERLLDEARADLGDSLTDVAPTGDRPIGRHSSP